MKDDGITGPRIVNATYTIRADTSKLDETIRKLESDPSFRERLKHVEDAMAEALKRAAEDVQARAFGFGSRRTYDWTQTRAADAATEIARKFPRIAELRDHAVRVVQKTSEFLPWSFDQVLGKFLNNANVGLTYTTGLSRNMDDWTILAAMEKMLRRVYGLGYDDGCELVMIRRDAFPDPPPPGVLDTTWTEVSSLRSDRGNPDVVDGGNGGDDLRDGDGIVSNTR